MEPIGLILLLLGAAGVAAGVARLLDMIKWESSSSTASNVPPGLARGYLEEEG